MCIYHTVRHCIEETWLNDRDQFLYPNDGWATDKEFQSDCLTFTLFQNNIQSKYGPNHWIPFSEREVNARDKFESNFMLDFIKGKLPRSNDDTRLFQNDVTPQERLEFLPQAEQVFIAGRALWRYYHSLPEWDRPDRKDAYNVNASLYDIREHFQGRKPDGKMNTKSADKQYTELITELRARLKVLARIIEPKVYEYGFLKL